ncbi:MAG: decarboxylating 6-phosphogluconate dehydrogenase [Candidatus Erginobacter occultus]|nr:decarboxylating 6-phosphogluconate dehydrogenase [Candidatus Erginobacter occultus]
MELGMIGLGKMGANMTARLLQGGHRVVVYDRDRKASARAGEEGAEPAGSPDELLDRLKPPRAVWVMVPAGKPTEGVIFDLAARLESGEIVIDGGNSDYRDTVRRGEELAKRGIHLVDVGTSGGVWGLKEGYSMMVGGEEAAVERIRPVLETLAPAPDRGWGRVGPPGSGHFVKMVHNGIEYGLMEAYAEGFELLRAKREFGLDLAAIAGIWRYGSVVRSWLLELIESALADNPSLDGFSAAVSDSGEGRWTAREGIELGVPLPAITLALQERFRSRDRDSFAYKLLSAARGQFGGHPVEEK